MTNKFNIDNKVNIICGDRDVVLAKQIFTITGVAYRHNAFEYILDNTCTAWEHELEFAQPTQAYFTAIKDATDIDMDNICGKTDSYKLNHWNQYPVGTQTVYSYFESRKGALFPYTVFFGLQYILKKNLVGQVVTRKKIEQAAYLAKCHFGDEKRFNRAGWEYILNKHNGYLPIRIKAVPEGSVIPTNNVLMTVENTDEEGCGWLTNYLESILTHVWYSSTVATLSRTVKEDINAFLTATTDALGGLNFMLHDFGYRGVSSDESAEIGGAGHLVNFLGTDTVPAMFLLAKYYNNGNLENIAYSVPATEHSIMTALGKEGEAQVVENLLNEYPTNILSVVADSYDIYNFVDNIVGKQFKGRILARDGVFVVRPDSVDPTHPTPESLMVWIFESLWNNIGGTINAKGYKVINPKVRVLWGDGIDKTGINKILEATKAAGFSIENIATFGMGGGLLQKINRDTQRFAFKSCAQKRKGVWFDIQKQPKDVTKTSKKGKLKLIKLNGEYKTVGINEYPEYADLLVTVFENGILLKEYTLEEIRKNAAL
jgi:nicotinamide phosphoribosyltransferase